MLYLERQRGLVNHFLLQFFMRVVLLCDNTILSTDLDPSIPIFFHHNAISQLFHFDSNDIVLIHEERQINPSLSLIDANIGEDSVITVLDPQSGDGSIRIHAHHPLALPIGIDHDINDFSDIEDEYHLGGNQGSFATELTMLKPGEENPQAYPFPIVDSNQNDDLKDKRVRNAFLREVCLSDPRRFNRILDQLYPDLKEKIKKWLIPSNTLRRHKISPNDHKLAPIINDGSSPNVAMYALSQCNGDVEAAIEFQEMIFRFL